MPHVLATSGLGKPPSFYAEAVRPSALRKHGTGRMQGDVERELYLAYTKTKILPRLRIYCRDSFCDCIDHLQRQHDLTDAQTKQL